jgi:hypothetical protein
MALRRSRACRWAFQRVPIAGLAPSACQNRTLGKAVSVRLKKYSHCEEAHGASALLMFRRIYRHHPVDGATLSE